MTDSPSILIVAAERGLGLGLAKQFFERGWQVTATALEGSDTRELQRIGNAQPERLSIASIDVNDAKQIAALESALGDRRFDVIFLNAGIFGPLHQSVLDATDAEFAQIMLTNTFGPIRLARRLMHRLRPRGALAFMSSHRGSVAGNVEGGLELYRASKAALNMLARGLYAELKANGHTVLTIHPGWVATDMGTLDGTVTAEIDVHTSVSGVADIVEAQRDSGQHLYVDYLGQSLTW